MLRRALTDYLERVHERDFDLPFLWLLPAMGFYDVHFTHGTVEFGKDFIAKRRDEGIEVQYSFQSKRGDVSQAEWRNNIQGQILESVLVPLSHPNFDKKLPHQAVLVLTGDLRNQAGLALQALNESIEGTHKKPPIICWTQSNLIDFIMDYGLEDIHGSTGDDYVEYGAFFQLYGQALQSSISASKIEEYSRQWQDPWIDPDRRFLWWVIEAEVLAAQCVKAGRVYEAIHIHLARIRALCAAAYQQSDDRLLALFQAALPKLNEVCRLYVERVRTEWEKEKSLVRSGIPSTYIVTYQVQCARMMMAAALAYFSCDNGDRKTDLVEFLDDFIQRESGCCNPISDQYAVSLVIAALALLDGGKRDSVARMLVRATMWLCDRYEKGSGLAQLGADEGSEIKMLLGFSFDFLGVSDRNDSFLAASLCDLAAFLGDPNLYADVLNDLQACEILPSYYRPFDTVGSCFIEGEDVLQIPSVSYAEPLTDFSEFRFANHVEGEPTSYRFVDVLGPISIAAVMTLIRDRYFPTIWPILVPNHRP